MIDGLYPEESELNKIRDWKPQDGYKELVNFVQVLWHWDDWGFKLYNGQDHLFSKSCHKLQLHTGGWSGNEDIIDALSDNIAFWRSCFWKHYAGGHYYFEIPDKLWYPGLKEKNK